MSKQVPARGLSANDSAAKGAVGQLYVREGKSYRYYKAKDIAFAANKVVEYSTTAGAVTIDRAGGSSVGRIAAGVAYGTVTAGNYGWVQVAGTCSMLVPAAGVVAAGNYLTTHATTDGAVVVATTSTLKNVFAVALGADTATTSGAGTVSAAILRI